MQIVFEIDSRVLYPQKYWIDFLVGALYLVYIFSRINQLEMFWWLMENSCIEGGMADWLLLHQKFCFYYEDTILDGIPVLNSLYSPSFCV